MQILYALSQEASLQIIIKCDLNTASAKAIESTSWLMQKEYDAGGLTSCQMPTSPVLHRLKRVISGPLIENITCGMIIYASVLYGWHAALLLGQMHWLCSLFLWGYFNHLNYVYESIFRANAFDNALSLWTLLHVV